MPQLHILRRQLALHVNVGSRVLIAQSRLVLGCRRVPKSLQLSTWHRHRDASIFRIVAADHHRARLFPICAANCPFKTQLRRLLCAHVRIYFASSVAPDAFVPATAPTHIDETPPASPTTVGQGTRIPRRRPLAAHFGVMLLRGRWQSSMLFVAALQWCNTASQGTARLAPKHYRTAPRIHGEFRFPLAA